MPRSIPTTFSARISIAECLKAFRLKILRDFKSIVLARRVCRKVARGPLVPTGFDENLFKLLTQVGLTEHCILD